MDVIKGQMTIFDLLKPAEEPKTQILSVGDKIGRVVLGEYIETTITKVEGLPNHPFYRTDLGSCFSYEEGLCDLENLEREALAMRDRYITIRPEDLTERFTVEYYPREAGGRVLWAQIGIYEDMLFWKENCTYQFLECFDSEKKLKKSYEKHRKAILMDLEAGRCKVVEKEHPMARLYKARDGRFASADYAKFNGAVLKEEEEKC